MNNPKTVITANRMTKKTIVADLVLEVKTVKKKPNEKKVYTTGSRRSKRTKSAGIGYKNTPNTTIDLTTNENEHVLEELENDDGAGTNGDVVAPDTDHDENTEEETSEGDAGIEKKVPIFKRTMSKNVVGKSRSVRSTTRKGALKRKLRERIKEKAEKETTSSNSENADVETEEADVRTEEAETDDSDINEVETTEDNIRTPKRSPRIRNAKTVGVGDAQLVETKKRKAVAAGMRIIKRKKKGTDEDEEKEVKAKKVDSMCIRTSPKHLVGAIRCLSKAQKECVVDMGFRSLFK